MARANSLVADFSASTVRSARRRDAWSLLDHWFDRSALNGNGSAGRRGVTGVTALAATNRSVVDDSTLGVQAAHTGARIDATVVGAALVSRTVRVLDAFGTARRVRIADVVGWADAVDGTVLRLALSISAARIGIAWTRWLDNIRFSCLINKLLTFLLN